MTKKTGSNFEDISLSLDSISDVYLRRLKLKELSAMSLSVEIEPIIKEKSKDSSEESTQSSRQSVTKVNFLRRDEESEARAGMLVEDLIMHSDSFTHEELHMKAKEVKLEHLDGALKMKIRDPLGGCDRTLGELFVERYGGASDVREAIIQFLEAEYEFEH